ncbi:Gfo/Idh/MocA family oxidoreductase [Vibrio tubiashii]|uniref:Gfo/Idh/MocA family protein n=2 Tax=Vibrio tubiashii TaxID=29498 RepID=UPI001EFD7184|nr:Gfo/Idh/MocA family oxidoreductase [Vibrio tubiashii]MCG9583672.1 Gfo/Idh/MocA family oxidoreductase [Vibrio tubiashii]MCG9617250.1 Gfo/Idh/MocA family oxidoreductase [Vibrio tubiashii]
MERLVKINRNLIKFAVVGLNHGKKHAESIMKIKGCELIATCTRTQVLGQNRLGNINNYTSYDELIRCEEIDALIISSPHQYTLDIFKKACVNIKYIFLEKPVSNTVKDIEEIKKLADKYNVKVLIGHHRRFSSAIEKLKAIVESKELGDLVAFNCLWCLKKHTGYYQEEESNWKIDPYNGGGPLFINGIHEIDTLRYIFGEISDVHSFVRSNFRHNKVEDSAVAVLKFKNGVIGNLLISDITPSPFSYEKTIDENKAFPISDVSYLQLFGTRKTLSFPEYTLYSTSEHESWFDEVRQTKLEKPRNSDPLYEEMKHFVDVVRTVSEPKVTLEDAISNLQVIEMIKRGA